MKRIRQPLDDESQQIDGLFTYLLHTIPYDRQEGYRLLPGYRMYRPNGAIAGATSEGDYLVQATATTFQTPQGLPCAGYPQEWMTGVLYDDQGPAIIKVYILAEAVTTDISPQLRRLDLDSTERWPSRADIEAQIAFEREHGPSPA